MEFRGTLPHHRIAELRAATEWALTQASIPVPASLSFETAVVDDMTKKPAAVYVELPSDDVVAAVVARCAIVRAAVHIWGEGATPEEACVAATSRIETLVRPHFPAPVDPQRDAAQRTWMVAFQRLGRAGKSGLDEAGKSQLLDTFLPVLKELHGSVDLKRPAHVLRYIEDWQGYHTLELAGLIGRDAGYDAELQLVRKRCFFGRVVAQGPSVASAFDLKSRAFIGVTAMQPMNAHVACVLAHVGPGRRVLDPFCGTASTLIAAAHLQADVIGSDIADHFADLDESLPARVAAVEAEASRHLTPREVARRQRWRLTLTNRVLRSKNSNFKRLDGRVQTDSSPLDSFAQYGLRPRVVDLFQADAHDWLAAPALCPNRRIRERYSDASGSFFVDAIVSDPPFGRREKFWTLFGGAADADDADADDAVAAAASAARAASAAVGTQFSMESSVRSRCHAHGATPFLMRLALLRLRRPGQRLVFWLPTSTPREDAVRHFLAQAIAQAAQLHAQSVRNGSAPAALASRRLVVRDVLREEMSTVLARWLCVVELVDDADAAEGG